QPASASGRRSGQAHMVAGGLTSCRFALYRGCGEEVAGMRDVAALLLGREAGKLLYLLAPEEDCGPGGGLWARGAEAGQRCPRTPGGGEMSRLALRQRPQGPAPRGQRTRPLPP